MSAKMRDAFLLVSMSASIAVVAQTRKGWKPTNDEPGQVILDDLRRLHLGRVDGRVPVGDVVDADERRQGHLEAVKEQRQLVRARGAAALHAEPEDGEEQYRQREGELEVDE